MLGNPRYLRYARSMAEPKFVRNLSDNKASTIAGVLVYLSKEEKHPLAFIYNEDPWRLLLLALRSTLALG